VPIGGVNVAVFSATLNHSKKAGYVIGAGAIVAEMIYCGIPLFGLAPYLEDLGIMNYMYLVFIPVLLFMGIWTIIKRRQGESDDADTGVKAHRRSYPGYFVYGFLLAISNPMTLVFWIQAVFMLRKEGVVGHGWDEILAYFLGVPIGTWLLYFGFVMLAAVTRRRINQVWKARLNLIIGCIFIFLACYLTLSYFMGWGNSH
jgi:L-lysine exporter family protein LysE/ArgO